VNPIRLVPLLLAASLAAEEAPIDLEARRESVDHLKRHIELRQERLDELVGDIRRLDRRTEERIAGLVDELARLEDSESSKTRITRLKGRVMRGLGRSIEGYQQKRARLLERLRRDADAPFQELSGDLEAFDERIEKRVEQILKLAKSLPAYEDVDKYEFAGGEYWNGYYHEHTRISEEWKQQRRGRVANDKERRELQQALEDNIADLEKRYDATRGMLDNRRLDERERRVQEQELGRIGARLDVRREELHELLLPADPGPQDPVDRNRADELAKLIETSAEDLSADLWELMRKYDQAAAEREEILKLRENLAARVRWLEQHDASAPAAER